MFQHTFKHLHSCNCNFLHTYNDRHLMLLSRNVVSVEECRGIRLRFAPSRYDRHIKNVDTVQPVATGKVLAFLDYGLGLHTYLVVFPVSRMKLDRTVIKQQCNLSKIVRENLGSKVQSRANTPKRVSDTLQMAMGAHDWSGSPQGPVT